MSFQVGDRVVYQLENRYHGERGIVTFRFEETDEFDRGTVVVIYAVQFDRPILGCRDCCGWTVNGRGRWCNARELSLEPTPIDHAGFLQLLGGAHETIII